jgi:hypothetical protein
MERTVWNDERLGDRFDNLDRTLERVDRDIRELRMLIFQLWGSTLLAILGVIVTVLLRT